MTLLSVNINKIALLRNSRGTGTPDLVEGARLALAGGAQGLTVHPRADERHITMADVSTIAAMDEVREGRVEFNVEGDLRPDLIDLVDLHDDALHARRHRAAHSLADAARHRDMIVLDHRCVIEAHAMIGRAALAGRIFLQHAQAGDGLAGIE